MLWTGRGQWGAGLTVLRVIGWLLIVIAVIFLGRDLYLWIHDGKWVATSGGMLWGRISLDSLERFQAVVERRLWAPLWTPILWILLQPVWLLLAIPGVILALLRRRPRRRRRFGRWRS
jgi:hypothetical protein